MDNLLKCSQSILIFIINRINLSINLFLKVSCPFSLYEIGNYFLHLGHEPFWKKDDLTTVKRTLKHQPGILTMHLQLILYLCFIPNGFGSCILFGKYRHYSSFSTILIDTHQIKSGIGSGQAAGLIHSQREILSLVWQKSNLLHKPSYTTPSNSL